MKISIKKENKILNNNSKNKKSYMSRKLLKIIKINNNSNNNNSSLKLKKSKNKMRKKNKRKNKNKKMISLILEMTYK